MTTVQTKGAQAVRAWRYLYVVVACEEDGKGAFCGTHRSAKRAWALRGKCRAEDPTSEVRIIEQDVDASLSRVQNPIPRWCVQNILCHAITPETTPRLSDGTGDPWQFMSGILPFDDAALQPMTNGWGDILRVDRDPAGFKTMLVCYVRAHTEDEARARLLERHAHLMRNTALLTVLPGIVRDGRGGRWRDRNATWVEAEVVDLLEDYGLGTGDDWAWPVEGQE